MPSRRDFLSIALRGSAATMVTGAVPAWLPRYRDGAFSGRFFQPGGAPQAGATQLGTVAFDVEWRQAFDEPISQGLGGRLIRNLSTLTPDTLITPNEQFFVRTARPGRLSSTANWKIAVSGMVAEPGALELDALLPLVAPQGAYLLECSGNPRRRSFGLISACEWSGIPAVDILERTRPAGGATRVLIGGFDEHSGVGGGTPGASWIFDPADLEAAGAFFATHMNGERLPDDHGFPVRLFIPGWYGCAAAKWVDRIEWVDDSAPATGQMKEYASRTGNDGVPELARDYVKGEMDLAAMPVRVEKWIADGRIYYRVVGIAWGGSHRVDALEVRFGEDAAWIRVQEFEHLNPATWNLWSHVWRPAAPGSYPIRLRVPDAGVVTRRLDRGYYDRTVTIEET